MSKNTLSLRLFIRIAPTIAVTIILIGVFAFYSANKEINTVYDAQLISNANVLWTLISDEIKETGMNSKVVKDFDLSLSNQLALNESADDYADSRMFRTWKKNELVLYSDNALSSIIGRQSPGFSTIKYKGDEWRIYALNIPDTSYLIEVGEKLDLRNALVKNILIDLAFPLLLLLPIIGVLIWVGINYGLGTIRDLITQIHSRSSDDLSHINTSILTEDLVPLVDSLNILFTKLENSFQAEKRFSDHAAHQLRTPLATLKLQLQMLANADDQKEREFLLKELYESNQRAVKLVSTLLTSTRLAHQEIKLYPVSLYKVLASAMAELGLLAKEKNIEMSLESDEHPHILADEIFLKLSMTNIIENAIKYTPAGGKLAAFIHLDKGKWVASIHDSGPGIPDDKRELVFERFYRINTPENEGNGLGLTIVREILNRFSGNITLKRSELYGGLLVEIALPACA